MKKSIYSKLIKHFDGKNVRVIVERHEYDVFVCDGFIMKKVPWFDYTEFFMKEKPYYINLEDGEGYTYDGRDLPTAKKQNTLYGIWDEAKKHSVPVHLSPVFVAYNKWTLRLGTVGEQPVSINNEYYELLAPLDGTDWYGESNIKPVRNETSLILPVRFGDDIVKEFNLINATLDNTNAPRANKGRKMYKLEEVPEDARDYAINQVESYADDCGEEIDKICDFANDNELMFDDGGRMYMKCAEY